MSAAFAYVLVAPMSSLRDSQNKFCLVPLVAVKPRHQWDCSVETAWIRAKLALVSLPQHPFLNPVLLVRFLLMLCILKIFGFIIFNDFSNSFATFSHLCVTMSGFSFGYCLHRYLPYSFGIWYTVIFQIYQQYLKIHNSLINTNFPSVLAYSF